MLSLFCVALKNGNSVGFRVSVDTPAEPAGHAHQVVVIQFAIGTVMEPPPPRADPPSRIAHLQPNPKSPATKTKAVILRKVRRFRVSMNRIVRLKNGSFWQGPADAKKV